MQDGISGVSGIAPDPKQLRLRCVELAVQYAINRAVVTHAPIADTYSDVISIAKAMETYVLGSA